MQYVIQLSEQSAAAASAVRNPRINLEVLPYVPQMSVCCMFVLFWEQFHLWNVPSFSSFSSCLEHCLLFVSCHCVYWSTSISWSKVRLSHVISGKGEEMHYIIVVAAAVVVVVLVVAVIVVVVVTVIYPNKSSMHRQKYMQSSWYSVYHAYL